MASYTYYIYSSYGAGGMGAGEAANACWTHGGFGGCGFVSYIGVTRDCLLYNPHIKTSHTSSSTIYYDEMLLIPSSASWIGCLSYDALYGEKTGVSSDFCNKVMLYGPTDLKFTRTFSLNPFSFNSATYDTDGSVTSYDMLDYLDMGSASFTDYNDSSFTLRTTKVVNDSTELKALTHSSYRSTSVPSSYSSDLVTTDKSYLTFPVGNVWGLVTDTIYFGTSSSGDSNTQTTYYSGSYRSSTSTGSVTLNDPGEYYFLIQGAGGGGGGGDYYYALFNYASGGGGGGGGAAAVVKLVVDDFPLHVYATAGASGEMGTTGSDSATDGGDGGSSSIVVRKSSSSGTVIATITAGGGGGGECGIGQNSSGNDGTGGSGGTVTSSITSGYSSYVTVLQKVTGGAGANRQTSSANAASISSSTSSATIYSDLFSDTIEISQTVGGSGTTVTSQDRRGGPGGGSYCSKGGSLTT